MKPVVFAGPSLHGVRHDKDAPYDLAPPAQCGDLLKAVRAGRKVIGLIDGTFEAGPAVWHKEIIFALASGCSVLGAASMGAIRAAECADFGMVGVGRIFADFKEGRRTADADVALLHGPAELGYLPLTVALADVDDALARLRAASIADAPTCAALARLARATFYKQRTWEGLLSAAALPASQCKGILAWLKASGPGLKARDALALLEELPRLPAVDRDARPFLATQFFSQLSAKMEA